MVTITVAAKWGEKGAKYLRAKENACKIQINHILPL